MSEETASDIRVRFAPSPTGDIHVGNVRTALFVWAFARHHKGTFIFRVEDTDRVRSTEASYLGLLDDLHWLGIDWDEGPEVGGPHAPYRQSERMDLYTDVAGRLLASGRAYHCYCAQEEVEARTKAAGRPPGYDGHCRELTAEQVAAFQAEGRAPVLRLRMPDRTITFDDLIRGEVSFEPEYVPDYVLVRADGSPLYTFVNPLDDALMEVTHVLRGEDLLSSTPRQIALYEALGEIGIGSGTPPRFGHLPFVMGEGNKKLSKRDPGSSLHYYRQRGFLPEGLLNYLALLGWSMGDDREIFTIDEMIAAFDLDRVSKNPARFDLKKCEAINGTKIRTLAPEDFAARITPFLQGAYLVTEPPTDDEKRLIDEAAPLVQERITVLSEAVDMLGFLFAGDKFAPDEADAGALLGAEAHPILEAAVSALDALDDWQTEAIQAALQASVVEGLGVKPRLAFGPLRVAVTGRRVSPPLFESMQLLGREATMTRLRAALERAGALG